MRLAIGGEGFVETPAFYHRTSMKGGLFTARVDCLHNPAFWAEVAIPRADFLALSLDGDGSDLGGIAVRGRSGHPTRRSAFRHAVEVGEWLATVRIYDEHDPPFRVDVHLDRIAMKHEAAGRWKVPE